MSDMIVFAIKHNYKDNIADINLNQTALTINHLETTFPKFFDGRHASNQEKEAYKGDAIFSYRYPSDGYANIVINNEAISYLPSGIGFYHEAQKARRNTHIVKRIFNQMKVSIRESVEGRNNKVQASIRKSSSRKWKPVDQGASYSLFGLYLKDLKSIDTKTVMPILAEYIKTMPWIKNNSLLHRSSPDKIHGTPFMALGNYRANQVATVSLTGNVFSAIALPNHGFNVDSINHFNNHREEYQEHQRCGDILNAFKYNLTVKDK